MARPSAPLTRRQKLLAGGVGAALLVLGAVRVIYLPVLARIGERRAALQELTVKIAEGTILIESATAHEAALQELQARSRALEGRLSDEQSLATVLETIAGQANAYRLELVAVQPRTDVHGQQPLALGPDLRVRAIPLSLQVTGRYRQVGEFLAALHEAPFLVSVRKVTMTRQQEGSAALQGDVELAVYLMDLSPSS